MITNDVLTAMSSLSIEDVADIMAAGTARFGQERDEVAARSAFEVAVRAYGVGEDEQRDLNAGGGVLWLTFSNLDDCDFDFDTSTEDDDEIEED